MNTGKPQRNIGIDVLKCVCALFVVMIHAPFRVYLAPYTVALARVAVPIFFIITGYYFLRMEEKERTEKHLRKICILTLASCLFYFLFHTCYLNTHPQRYLQAFIQPKAVINFICFNACPIEGHLWYFFSLMYAIPVLMWLHRMCILKKLAFLIPVLLIGNYLLTYTGHYEYYRNWLFTALPYMGIGIFIRHHHDRIVRHLPPTKVLCSVYLLLCLLLYLEWHGYYRHHAIAYRDDYLCTPWMAICLFLIAIKPTSVDTTSCRYKTLYSITHFMAHVGRKYSPYIYVFHIAVKDGFHFWRHWRFIYPIYPLWIFGFTGVLCYIGIKIWRLVPGKRKAN